MAKLEIEQFPCLSDNFGVLIHDDAANVTASIDAPDADAVNRALQDKGWRLSHILTTHHHADHTGGNLALKAATGCKIIGPRAEKGKIPGIDEAVGQGDSFHSGVSRTSRDNDAACRGRTRPERRRLNARPYRSD